MLVVIFQIKLDQSVLLGYYTFLHLFQKRTFMDIWHRLFICQLPDQQCHSTEAESKH